MLEELMSSAQTEVAGQTNEEVQAEQTVETVEPTTTEEVTTEVPTINEIDINGQKVSLDEVRQGYIRQQDYIAKQQQLDAKLKEAEQSLQLVDYLRKNPQIAQRLYEDEKAPSVVQTVNPAMQEIENLKRELFQDKLNNTITNLKGKYSDFNEVEVMNKAVSMGVTDLEFVYNAMRGQNLDNIIAQRVKEELAAGKTATSAIKTGFKRAFITIFDSNITTILASIVLWILCPGSIKGFAITLLIGIVLSMFTAIVVTRSILKLIYNISGGKTSFLGLKREVEEDED